MFPTMQYSINSKFNKMICLLAFLFFVIFPTTIYNTVLVPTPMLASFSTTATDKGTDSKAYSESFGFFDDISDSMWQRMKDRVQESTLISNPNAGRGKKNPAEISRVWYTKNADPNFSCPHIRRVGSPAHGDGPKWVCDPHRLVTQSDCLVYSVGSHGAYQFEDGIHSIAPRCEIHVFDFGNYARSNDSKNNIFYHQWGLGKKTEDKLKTLSETVSLLGHKNRTIDLFKIDCEGCEWSTYKDWFEFDLRQILVEVHNAPATAPDFFQTLAGHGYVIFSKEANLFTGGSCLEYSFLKLHQDFFNKVESA